MLRWLWLSLVVIVLDQASKWWASSALHFQEPRPVMPFFDLTLMHNYGAAFSFLAGAGGWQRYFFATVAVLASAAITFWLKRLESHQRWEAAALALVLGGALGNLWDRLSLGYVVDFIHLYYGPHYWPAFNIADSAITLGAAMLVIDVLFLKRQHSKA
ncbi:MAG TPA: signal peptidase II [Gammaproteobacteria bacterium]